MRRNRGQVEIVLAVMTSIVILVGTLWVWLRPDTPASVGNRNEVRVFQEPGIQISLANFPDGTVIDDVPILKIDEALVRAFLDKQTVDILVLSHKKFLEYQANGFIQSIQELANAEWESLHKLLPEGMLIWGQINGQLYCFSTGGVYVCLSPLSRQKQRAYNVAKSIALRLARDSDDSTAYLLMRKFLVEKDFRTVYRSLLSPERKRENTGVLYDWTEEQFLETAKTYVQTLGPIVDITFNLDRKRRLIEDPLHRRTYKPPEIRCYELKVDFGTQGSKRILGTEHINLTLHVQEGYPYPTRRYFQSPQLGFENFCLR